VVVVVVIVAAAVAIKITEHLPLHTWPSLATFDGCCGNQRTKPANNKTSCDVAVVIVFACQHFWLYIYFLVFFFCGVYPHWQHLISFIAGSGKRQPPKLPKLPRRRRKPFAAVY